MMLPLADATMPLRRRLLPYAMLLRHVICLRFSAAAFMLYAIAMPVFADYTTLFDDATLMLPLITL